MHTKESVAAVIQASVESNVPDLLLQELKPFDGKKITTRLEKVLPHLNLYLSRQYGWTHLVTRDYLNSGGNKGFRIILARSEQSVPLDLAWVEAENPSHFAGRRARNEERLKTLSNPMQLQAIAGAMNAVEQARGALKQAEATFEEMSDGAYRYTLNKVLEAA